MIGEWELWQGSEPNPWPRLVVVLKNQEKKKPGTEQPVAYICFCKGHRQSGWCKSMEPWVSLSPLQHRTPPMPTIALMVAQPLHLPCFAKSTSCHHFSARPEISPCTALENWVLNNMSCTSKKKETKEKNINNQTFKKNLSKINSTVKVSTRKSYGKSTQLIKNCTTVRWWSSLRDKVLCRKVAAKRVEDGADKQSACSQVLVRQISQLANAASGDSFRTHEKCCSCWICSPNLP